MHAEILRSVIGIISVRLEYFTKMILWKHDDLLFFRFTLQETISVRIWNLSLYSNMSSLDTPDYLISDVPKKKLASSIWRIHVIEFLAGGCGMFSGIWSRRLCIGSSQVIVRELQELHSHQRTNVGDLWGVLCILPKWSLGYSPVHNMCELNAAVQSRQWILDIEILTSGISCMRMISNPLRVYPVRIPACSHGSSRCVCRNWDRVATSWSSRRSRESLGNNHIRIGRVVLRHVEKFKYLLV